jgi:hypothetical protein
MSDADELRNLWDGFEHYGKPKLEDVGRVLQAGIVAIDTNVLLHLYKCGATARGQIFDVLQAIAESLFMPAQVQHEFWRKRDGVIREVVTTSSLSGLRDAWKRASSEVKSWGRRTMSTTEADELHNELDVLFKKVLSRVSSDDAGKGINLKAALRGAEDDEIFGRLLEIYRARIGQPYAKEEFDAYIRRGSERFDKSIPPGYMDAWKQNQVEEGVGDYLIWEQLIDRAAEVKKDVLFVTDDEKEDWWRLGGDGEPIAPRVELMEEMEGRAGVKLYMLTRQSFLTLAKEFLPVTVDDSTIDEPTPPDITEEPTAWTTGRLEALLVRLSEVGAGNQGRTLRYAAGPGSGFIPRQKVYDVCGFSPDRSLVGFTKPVVNATWHLQRMEELPEDLEAAFEAVYSKPGTADGFRVPDSIVEAARSLPASAPFRIEE